MQGWNVLSHIAPTQGAHAVDKYRADSKVLSVMAAVVLVIPARFFRFCFIFQRVGPASL
jgi:hypothetical protein